MRLGWLAAAAALVALTGEAQAAKWIRYTASGLGNVTEYDVDQGVSSGGADKIYYSFTVDVEPFSLDDTDHQSDGSSFYRPRTDGVEIFASATAIGLRYSELLEGHAIEIVNSLQVTFDPWVGSTGFPLIAPEHVRGRLSYSSGGHYAGTEVTGTIRRLGVQEVAGFERASFDATIFGVPEPTTWAMMISGFGLIGGAIRRQLKVTKIARFA